MGCLRPCENLARARRGLSARCADRCICLQSRQHMMARSTGNTVIFAAFGTLCLMFAAIALTPWMIDPLDYLGHSDPATAPVEQSLPRGLPTLDAPAIESFAEIVDRPLFTATRRAAPQSEPTPPATVADAPDESLLLGRYQLT